VCLQVIEMWFVKTRTIAAVKSNHGGEMWFVKTRAMAAITIQPRRRDVVRETRTMAAVKTRTMAAVKTRTMAALSRHNPLRRNVVREDTNHFGCEIQTSVAKCGW